MNNRSPVFHVLLDEAPEEAFKRCASEQSSQITEEIWLILLVMLADTLARKNSPHPPKHPVDSLHWETEAELLARLSAAQDCAAKTQASIN